VYGLSIARRIGCVVALAQRATLSLADLSVLLQALRFTFEGPIDLDVVFELAFAFDGPRRESGERPDRG